MVIRYKASFRLGLFFNSHEYHLFAICFSEYSTTKNEIVTPFDMKPVFIIEEYKEYANTQVRKLTSEEIQKYMSER